MASQEKRKCFVIGPIGESDSEARIHADWLLEEIIQPVFRDFVDFEVTRADQIALPGMIDAQIIRYLIDADLVIADLSALNPNAFYELGVRHMVQKPTIHMQLADDKIPFDVSLYRAIKFSRIRPADLRRAREELKRAVSAVVAPEYEVENPVTRARGQIQLVEHATPEAKLMFETLQQIQERLEYLERQESDDGHFSVYPEQSGKLREFYVHYISTQRNPADLRYRVARLLKDTPCSVSLNKVTKIIEVSGPGKFFETAEWKNVESTIEKMPNVVAVSEIPF